MTGATPGEPRDATQLGGIRARLRPVLALADPWKRDLRYGVASGATQQVLFIAGASIVAYTAARAARGATYDSLSLWLLALVIIVLPQVRTPWLEAISFQAIANRVQVALRAQVYDHLVELTPAGLSGRRSGELGYTAMTDVETIHTFFAATLSTLIVAGIVPTLTMIALAVLAWPLAAIVTPLLVAAAAAPVWIHTCAEHGTADLHDQLADLSAEIVDSIQGMREIVAFRAEDAALTELAERADRAVHLQAVHDRHSAVEAVLSEALVGSGVLLSLGAGAALVVHHWLSPTLLAPAVVLAALSFGPVGRFGDAAKGLRHVAAAGNRIFALLATPAPVADHARNDVELPARPGVAFDHVSFRYGTEELDAAHDVTFTVEPGTTVALVGPSGAGKSTCVNLMLRFWDPASGAVLLGGVDLRALPQRQLHLQIGLVTQDTYLFNATIRDNLRLGRPDAADHDIQAAAEVAQAWEFITALPDGLDTNTGERGIQLSGGQSQRIAIARVVLADPPVLILDEPVSNLDAANERAITKAMRHVRTGRTTVIIAHRLSTTRHADHIVVLNHGRIAEAGTHDQLIARQGPYAQLVAGQVSITQSTA